MKSLYARLTYPVIILLGVAVLSVIAVSVINIRWFIAPDIRRITTDLMDSKSNEINYWLDSRITEITRLAGEIPLETGGPEEVAAAVAQLELFRERNSEVYESMGIVSLDAFSHVTTGDIFDVRNRDYYIALQREETDLVISDIIVSRANGASVLLILKKIYNSRGAITGYLSSAVESGYLREIVSRANIRDFPVRLVNRETRRTLIASDLTGSPGEERGHTLFSAPIRSYPLWIVEMLVPDSFLDRRINTTILLIVLLGAAVLGMAITLNRRSTAKLVAPIASLEDHMQRLAQGIFIPIQPDTSCAEIHSLGHSYNSMLDNMQTLIRQVRDEQQQKRRAEYRALCAQIKPHFLYNILETIQSMAIEGDYGKVESAIGGLARFFRTGLATLESFIPLADELSHLESYLEIQQLRYEGRFSFTLDAEGVPMNQRIMKFSLQPLVENAINHGIRSMERGGTIRAVIRNAGGVCEIRIENNYLELDAAKIEEVNRRLGAGETGGPHGHGIFNLNERLRLEFGSDSGVALFAGDGIVIARVRFPVISGGEEPS
ncbi:histidine kinase [Breznakiella homolactica]|uniref:Histidine kinase n=1 Tax=Breznakiella homolactica TaxID=2798577 RepID=A0A7T7XND2_9SPIR|nr:histidine kinase [Breznakiella homolactica]QQO09412.1 histidine kinase [Breznakiella homolactica]